MAKKVLILCTGNSCRSQMAEGILKRIAPEFEVYSAGTHPEKRVHPLAVRVMEEIGIDLSKNKPKSVTEFFHESFDYIITVCDNAREECSTFPGKARRFHFGFEDPARFEGSFFSSLEKFREIRDQIEGRLIEFYNREIKRN